MKGLRYFASLRIQSEYGKILTRKTPNTDTFHAVSLGNQLNKSEESSQNPYTINHQLLSKFTKLKKMTSLAKRGGG